MTFLTETVPSGDQHDIQYNKDGFLYGDDNLEWDSTEKIMTINGDLTFPFINAIVKLTISGGTITDTEIFVEGYGYKNITTSVNIPGGQNGTIDVYVVDNVVDNIVVIDSGSGYIDGIIELSLDIPRYGSITANKFIVGDVVLENNTITGLTNLDVSETVTAQNMSIGSVVIQNNSVSGITDITSNVIVTDELTISNVSINDTVGISGLSTVSCSGSATIGDLNISGLTITTNNIAGVNNLAASGTISVAGNITSGNVIITSNDITGVNDITSNGTLFINALNVNNGAITLDNLGNFVTSESITTSNKITATTITDGTLTINNGIITGATDLAVSNNISLQGTLTVGSVILSNDNLSGFNNVSATGTITSSGKVTAGSINAPIGSNMTINSSGSTVTINEVTFQSNKVSAANVNVSDKVQFSSTGSQRIYSTDNISIETPSGIVTINGTSFDTSGNITSANNLTTTGTISADTFNSGSIVITNNNITGISDLEADTFTSGTLTITGPTPSIDSLNKITISSGSNPTIVNGVSFQEGNISTIGNITASEIVSGGTLQLTSLTPTIESANDISITSTGGLVNIGGLTINNGQMTNVKSITTTTDITIGGDLSLDGTAVMDAAVTVISELVDASTLTGQQGSYINGVYTNTLSNITVTVTVASNVAAITNITIAESTPDNTYIIPITIPLLGRITSTGPIIITSTNGTTIDTTTITSTGDVTTNSLTTGSIKTDTLTSDLSSIAITNPGGNVTISGITITPTNNVTGIADLILSGTLTSDNVISESFTSTSGTFTTLSAGKIVVDDFTIGDVVFDNSNISNVNSINCTENVTAGNLTIIGTLNVDNINTSQIGGVTFDTGNLSATTLTTSGNITASDLLLSGGTKTMDVTEITSVTKIAGISFNGTSISGLTSLTSTGTITANTLTLSGNIVADTISNPSGTLTIDSIDIVDGNISNVLHVDMSGDLTSSSVSADVISSHTDLVISPLPSTNEIVRLISTTNVSNIPLFISGASAGLTLTVDGTTTWSINDRFLITSQTSSSENDIYEIINNVDPIRIQRVYENQSVYSKSFTSSIGTVNSAKTFVSTNTYNRSQSGIDILIFAESTDPTLTVGGIGIRSGAIDASKITTSTLNVNNVSLKHIGTQPYSLVLPVSLGATGTVLVLGSAGQLEWANPTAYTLGGSEGSIQFSNGGLFEGNADLTWTDNTGLSITGTNKLIVNDLEISHDTTDGLIFNQTGNLTLKSNNDVILKSSNLVVKNIAGTQVASISSTGDFTTSGNVTIGPILVNAGVVTGVVYTTDPSSLVSKEYVDKLALGVKWVSPVTVHSDTAVVLVPAPSTINGITLTLNMRVLLTGQAPSTQNGIYFLDISGNLSRPLSGEFATGYSASGSTVNVTNSKEAWLCNSPSGSSTVGTHDLTFIKLVSGGINTGKGVSMSGNTINLDINTDQFEFVANKLSFKQIPIENLSENTINITGDSGVVISNSTPALGETTTISLDRSVIMDINSDQTLTGVKTFQNGLTVSELNISSDLNIIGTITAEEFISGNISITGSTVHGINDLNVTGTINASNVITGSIIVPAITSSDEITISGNNGVKIQNMLFNKNIITNVNSINLTDNISTSNIVKQTGDITILPGSGSSVVVNGVNIKDGILSNVKGINATTNAVLFGDTTGTLTIGGNSVSSLVLTSNDSITLGTASGTVTSNDLIVSSDLLVQGNTVFQGDVTFTSTNQQTISKDIGTLAFIGDTITVGNVTFADGNLSGLGELTSTSIVSANVSTGNLNVTGIISATDLDITTPTGIVNIGSISFDNGVISGAGDLKTNNILASNTTNPSTIFTDSTSIVIGGTNTTSITMDSSTTNISGNAIVTGDILVSGNATVTGDISVTGDLIFDNDTITKISGDLIFTAPLINLNGVKINTNGDLNLNAISVAGEINVSGSTYIARSLTHETLTIGDGTIGNVTTIEGSVFTNGTLSTGTVQCNEIQASTGSVMNILAGTESIKIGGSSTDTIDIQADVVKITGSTATNLLDITSSLVNVSGTLSVGNSIQFTGVTANSITSASDLNIVAPTTIINNTVVINDTKLTSTVPISCNLLDTSTVSNVNVITSSTGITIDAPTLSIGNVVINTTDDSITGLTSLTTATTTTDELTTSSILSDSDLIIESSGGLTINGNIVISKAGGLTGITELLTNSLQSSNTSADVNIYTETAGVVRIGTGADTINMGSEATTINIGTNANTNVNIGDPNGGYVTIDSYKTTVLGDISTTGNLTLQGNDSTISSGTSGQLTINTGTDGTLSLNGFEFSKVNNKAVIDYTSSDATTVSLFDSTPGNVSIGGTVTDTIILDSKDLVEISSDQVNIFADESINIGSSGKVTIEAGQEGIVITSSKNVSVSSNVTISGDVFVSGNIQFTDSNVFDGFSSIKYPDESIVNASNLIVSGVMNTDNLSVNNISSNEESVTVFADSNLEIGGDSVKIGNANSTVTLGSIVVKNDTIYTPERLNIHAHVINLGNPDDPDGELHVNKKVRLNGGIEKVRSLKATHLSTNFLRCNRMQLASDPSGFYETRIVSASYGTSIGSAEYTRMGNFVNISGTIMVSDKSAVKLNLSNCPKTKKPTVIRVGTFPQLKPGLSQVSLVDTADNFTHLDVRIYDANENVYRNLMSSDFINNTSELFTFSGSYTTDIYIL